MKIIKSFAGFNINDFSTYRAKLLNAGDMTEGENVFVDIPGADSVSAETFVSRPRALMVSIFVAQANRDANVEQLRRWLKRGRAGELVITDSNDGLDYALQCSVRILTPTRPFDGYYTLILETGESAYKAVIEDTAATWAVSGSGGTQVVAVGGSGETALSLRITTVAAPAGSYLYQNTYQMTNPTNVALGWRWWCLTVNTAALVTAGKMQADCDDLRIYINGRETPRWIDGPNTTTTKIWFVILLRAGASMTLKTAITSGFDGKIAFVVDADTKAQMAKMPKQGLIYHGSEWIAYKNLDPAGCTVDVRQRAAQDTTASAHSANDVFLYVQNVVQMVYGRATATNPATGNANYNKLKPPFKLSSSTNNAWAFDATSLFFIAGSLATWKAWLKRDGTVSETYDIKENASSGDPALGLLGGAYLSGTAWNPDNVDMRWAFSSLGGMQEVSMTGRKYRSKASWPAVAALERSVDGKKWYVVWSEGTPGSALSWTAWTHNSVSIPNTTRYLRLRLSGRVEGAGARAYLECLTATLTFTSGNLPTGSFLGEQSNHDLDIEVENETTGDTIGILLPMRVGKVFSLDGEAFECTYDGANVHDAVTLNDESRTPMIGLLPGNNSITIRSNGGSFSVDLSYYKRRM